MAVQRFYTTDEQQQKLSKHALVLWKVINMILPNGNFFYILVDVIFPGIFIIANSL